MNEQIIAKRLKELRNSLHLTQNDFGELINVAQTTLSSYEKGTKVPNIETLCNIAKKCNISLDWLCGHSDIQKTKDFTSYSDIFRLLVNICKSVEVEVMEYHHSQNNFDAYEMALIAENPILEQFLEKWAKVKAIYDDGTLDNDTYEIVIKSLIDKYDTDTLYYNHTPIDDDIQL